MSLDELPAALRQLASERDRDRFPKEAGASSVDVRCRFHDLAAAAVEKIRLNAARYPVGKVRGSSKKYTED
jgi:hypothetical protein